MEAINSDERESTLLIPTDFSEVCDNAIIHGIELAKFMKLGITLLHVINKDTKNYLEKTNLDGDVIEKKLKEVANEFATKYDISVNTVIEKGDLFKKIGRVALDVNASLVILGTHGKTGFQHLTGSYAVKVITNSTVPVIVVQEKALNEGYKNIVFPVTVSTNDRQKVNWAVAIGRTFDATIHIFPKYESEKYLKNQIMSVTKQIKNTFTKNDIKHIDRVSDERGGNFAKQVVDYAVSSGADIIIIMMSRDSLLPMLSSWDEQIIFNSSQIPVICINPVKLEKTYWR